MPAPRLPCSALPLLVVLLAQSAAAQPAPPPDGGAPSASTADKAAAARAYAGGAKLAKQGRWKDAYPLFLEAWDHLHHWQIALGLGRVEIELARFHAAEQHLSFALASPELPSVDRPEVTRLIARARASQGKVRITAASATAAEVWIDDERAGDTPFSGTLSADPGEHRVELRSGAEITSRLVTVTAGETSPVDIELVAPAARGAEGPVDSPSSSSPRVPLLGAGLGLTASALALGVGLTVAAADRAAELEAKGRFAENQSIENDRALLLNGAIWSFIAAGVAGGGTLATWLLWPAEPGKPATGLRFQWTGPGARAEVRW